MKRYSLLAIGFFVVAATIAVAVINFTSGSDTTTTTLPHSAGNGGGAPAGYSGPIGPASGQVEYICTNGAYSGDVYNAVIAAVQDATGKWLCASPAFPTQSVMALTGKITCTYDVIQKAPYQYWTTQMDPLSPTGYKRVQVWYNYPAIAYGPYPAMIGPFNWSGASYYGAYCSTTHYTSNGAYSVSSVMAIS